MCQTPETVVTDSYDLPCGCWELTLDPLKELPVLLATELSFQPQGNFLNDVFYYFKLFVHICGYVHISVGACGVQKRALDLLE